MLFLYDPRTNILTETTYDYLVELTGWKRASLASYKSRHAKIQSINCYLADEKVTLKQRKAWYEKEKYPDESWLIVKGSEDKFLISNYGRVKRVYKKKQGFLLPYQRKGHGNLWVKLKYNGRYGEYKVGQLVAAHFIREPRPGESVVRKNGIITDDYAGNLEYVTKKELGKMNGHKAKSKPVVQLDVTTEKVIEEYRSVREAGRQLYLSHQTVLDNCHGKTKMAAGTYKFMFLEDYENKFKEHIS